jgi:guanine deaminase
MATIHEINMKIACDLAETSVGKGGGPFGCVITDPDGTIIGKGYNMVTINNDPTQHAEIVAIRDACKNLKTFELKDCILYTSCEPCPMCLSATYWARCKEIYYGNSRIDAANIGFDDEFIYDELAKPIEHRTIPTTQCSTKYAKHSFQCWTDKTDKTRY